MNQDVFECKFCSALVPESSWKEHLYVCPECGAYRALSPAQRIGLLLQEDSFEEIDKSMTSVDPLSLSGYQDKLTQAELKSHSTEAITTGTGKLLESGEKIALGVMNFAFMGGSMGSVVGEKIVRLMHKAIQERLPLFLFTSSGGARMQEGIFSLMQMARTSELIARMNEAAVPFFVILTNPTMGGVTASFGMLGDVILAEPDAFIGFAGPRVIAGTVGEKLPEGFQKSEFQLKSGFIDSIVERKDMISLFNFLVKTHKVSEVASA